MKEKKMKKLFRMVIGLGLLSLLLAACGGVPTPQSTFPTGKFVLPDNEFEGVYFDENGTWYAFFGGEHVAEGTYSTKGDLYIEESNDSNCGKSPMSFKYSFDGTNLKFDLTDESRNDTCENRRLSFDGITYVLTE
jgi:hypothetical protein